MMSNSILVSRTLEHLGKISENLGNLSEPLHGRMAGGVAVNYYVDYRMSMDVDIQWSHLVPIAPHLKTFRVEDSESENGYVNVKMDENFNDYFGLFPPDWLERCLEITRINDMIISVIEPHDLAVSKAAPFRGRDQEDILQLARAGLLQPELFSSRAEEALDYFTRDSTFVKYNVRDSLEIIENELQRQFSSDTACEP